MVAPAPEPASTSAAATPPSAINPFILTPCVSSYESHSRAGQKSTVVRCKDFATRSGRRRGLAPQEVAREEQRVRGPLGEPPHEVRVPLRAVRCRDEDFEAAPRELL